MGVRNICAWILSVAIVFSFIAIPATSGSWTGSLTNSYAVSTADFAPSEFEADIKITPRHLNGDSEGNFVKATIKLPDACDVATIDLGSVVMRQVGGSGSVPALGADPDITPGGKNSKRVSFDREAVIAMLAGNEGDVTLEVSGDACGGGTFSGVDTIFFDDPDKAEDGD